jgi:hypothetical protein
VLGALAIIGISIIISLYEFPPLIRGKLYKEIGIFFSLLSIGSILSILLSFGVQFPNPSLWLINLFKPLSNLLENLLN